MKVQKQDVLAIGKTILIEGTTTVLSMAALTIGIKFVTDGLEGVKALTVPELLRKKAIKTPPIMKGRD